MSAACPRTRRGEDAQDLTERREEGVDLCGVAVEIV
jgi:hypothetical protein